MSLFSRRINVDVEEEGENLRIRGILEDERLGEPLHVMEAEVVMSVFEGEIKEIRGSMPRIPMPECGEGVDSLEMLVGTRIKPGFTDTVKQTVGSNKGCSHLAALIMTIGNVSVQGRGAFIRKHLPADKTRDAALKASAEELGLLDSCVSWREDGPLVRRWREEHNDEERPY